jgi:hypothetical protein
MTAEDIKTRLLQASDELGIAEETLWNMVEDNSICDPVSVCVYVKAEDDIELTLAEANAISDGIFDLMNARYLEGQDAG